MRSFFSGAHHRRGPAHHLLRVDRPLPVGPAAALPRGDGPHHVDNHRLLSLLVVVVSARAVRFV